MLFKKNKTPDKFYKETDCGRVFGWWLCLNGERIAELNYWCFDVGSQFWHEYKLFPFNSKFDDIGYDPDRWSSNDISLESRFAESYHVTDFVMSTRQGNLIAIRNAFVPEEMFSLAISKGTEPSGAEHQ